MTASILRKNDWQATEKLHNRRKSYFRSFVHKMKDPIELRRSKNLGIGVFVIVGAAMYLARKFPRDLRDQNGTLSKLKEPK